MKMLTRSRVILCLCVFLAVLAGCDTNEPDVPPEPPAGEELIGTWTLEYFSGDTYLTASTAQPIIDPDEPGEGQITLTGALEAELSYLRKTFPLIDPAVPIYASDVPLGELLGLADGAGEAVRLRVLQGDPISASIFIGLERRYAAEETSGITFDAESNTLTFDDVTLSASSGATVTASGMLEAATQPLPAGEETLVGGFSLKVDNSPLTITFEGDRTFTAEVGGDGDDPQETVTGTWRVEGGELILETEGGADERLPPQRVAYRIEEGRLIFEDAMVDFFEASEEELLALYEVIYDAETGTLTDIAHRFELRFAASSSASP